MDATFLFEYISTGKRTVTEHQFRTKFGTLWQLAAELLYRYTPSILLIFFSIFSHFSLIYRKM